VSTYTLIHTPPSVEAYMHLREATGLSPKSLQAATLGLAGTWYGVHIGVPGVISGKFAVRKGMP
jgi:hypothetical protein